MTVATEDHHINYRRIEEAIIYLEKNFRSQPDLDEVAEKVHLSPYHFQRMFAEWAGISPKRFLQYLTVGFLKERLQYSRNLVEVAEEAGFNPQSLLLGVGIAFGHMVKGQVELIKYVGSCSSHNSARCVVLLEL